jgi:hypothetical protein
MAHGHRRVTSSNGAPLSSILKIDRARNIFLEEVDQFWESGYLERCTTLKRASYLPWQRAIYIRGESLVTCQFVYGSQEEGLTFSAELLIGMPNHQDCRHKGRKGRTRVYKAFAPIACS